MLVPSVQWDLYPAPCGPSIRGDLVLSFPPLSDLDTQAQDRY
jgi:hypothetical protein